MLNFINVVKVLFDKPRLYWEFGCTLLSISPHLNTHQCPIKYPSSEGDVFFMHLVQTLIRWVACVVNDVPTLHLNYAQICVGRLNFGSCCWVVLHICAFKVILSLKKQRSWDCAGQPLYRNVSNENSSPFMLSMCRLKLQYVVEYSIKAVLCGLIWNDSTASVGVAVRWLWSIWKQVEAWKCDMVIQHLM